MDITAVTNERESNDFSFNFKHSSTYSNQFNHNHKNVEEKKDFTKILNAFLVATSSTYSC